MEMPVAVRLTVDIDDNAGDWLKEIADARMTNKTSVMRALLWLMREDDELAKRALERAGGSPPS